MKVFAHLAIIFVIKRFYREIMKIKNLENMSSELNGKGCECELLKRKVYETWVSTECGRQMIWPKSRN